MVVLCRLIEFSFDRSLKVSPVAFIVITNVISLVLSAIAFHEKTGGGMAHGQATRRRVRNDIYLLVFQVLVICFDILSLLSIIGW